MPEIDWKIPKKNQVPEKVSVPVQSANYQKSEKPNVAFQARPNPQNQNFQRSNNIKNMNERALSFMIETAKNNNEASSKITNMIMSSLDVPRFKEKLIEEALSDPQLRNKIMLELLKRI